ncbi:unnamed protein product [Peniophora sp. CBMAI 1063]|nr:unnamed protein product [Peniophora sp. CBMAI 1063]
MLSLARADLTTSLTFTGSAAVYPSSISMAGHTDGGAMIEAENVMHDDHAVSASARIGLWNSGSSCHQVHLSSTHCSTDLITTASREAP